MLSISSGSVNELATGKLSRDSDLDHEGEWKVEGVGVGV
jgi:hypothetical protein